MTLFLFNQSSQTLQKIGRICFFLIDHHSYFQKRDVTSSRRKLSEDADSQVAKEIKDAKRFLDEKIIVGRLFNE